MHYEVTIPGERMPCREFVYRVPLKRTMMPWHPFDPSILGPKYEEVARAVVRFRRGIGAEVVLLSNAYTLAREDRVILRAPTAISPSRIEAGEFLRAALAQFESSQGGTHEYDEYQAERGVVFCKRCGQSRGHQFHSTGTNEEKK